MCNSTDCSLTPNADGLLHCPDCGWIYKPRHPFSLCRKPPRRNCPASRSPEAIAEQARQQSAALEAGAKLGWTEERSPKFAGILAHWVAEGCELREPEEIDELMEFCEPCKNHALGKCVCGGCGSILRALPVREAARLGTVGCPAFRW